MQWLKWFIQRFAISFSMMLLAWAVIWGLRQLGLPLF